tara:strand:+ start:365 stop:751 length:387 start_codon:yes stop_codon:yes gene_type:complete
MSDKFTVEIISPDKSIIKDYTTEVIIPAYEGEIGILKDHIPLITFLRPGKIKIKDINEELFVEEGIVEFVNNNLLILSSTVKKISEIDKGLIEDYITEAQKKMEESKATDKEKYLLSYKINTLKNLNL